MIAFLRFLVAARDFPIGVARLDSRMGGNGQAGFVPLPSGARHKFDDIGLLRIFGSRGSNPVNSLISVSRSSEVVWALVEPAQMWYPYQFSLGQFYDVPEQRVMSSKCNSVGNQIHGSEVEPLGAVRWWGKGSLVLNVFPL